jgi:magnesium transporter
MIKTIYRNELHVKEQRLFQNPDFLPDLDYLWIDLLAPTDQECRLVESHFSVSLLNQEQSSEIEASSKILIEEGLIVLNLVYVSEKEGESAQLTPVWFYLFNHKLLSVRSQNIGTFNGVRDTILKSMQFNTGSEIGFLLVEERIDHAAMKMKEMILTISTLNSKINIQRDLSKQIIHELNERMEYLLMFRVATMNTELTLSHLMMLPTLHEKQKLKIHIMQNDVKTLLEYSEFSINRLDYMLTTFTAYISIEQNNSMKVFTMVTVASTPAIFISSFYGMNFEGIPMMHWKHGFIAACVLMVALTAISIYLFRKIK